jgi:hypothetical protein
MIRLKVLNAIGISYVECEMSLVRFFDFKLYLGPGVLRHLGSADPASLGYYVLNSLGEVGLNAGFFVIVFPI